MHNPKLLFVAGTARLQLGQHDKGIELVRRSIALNPANPEAHNNLGNAFRELKQLEEAQSSYEQALAFKPNYAVAYNNLGGVLMDLKRPDKALANFEKAVSIAAEYAEAYSNMSKALMDLGRIDEALASAERAVSINPGYTDAYNNMGNILRALKRPEEALASYQKAISIKPDDAMAHSNMALALKDLGRFDEALAYSEKAVSIQPDYAAAYSNMGNTLRDLMRLDEAMASYQKAVSIDPDYTEAHWNISRLLLLRGRYVDGWKLFEWRLRKEDTKDNYYDFLQPSWRGEKDIAGKTLLVHTEQGYGDVIQFCRYLPQIETLGAKIVFEAPHMLLPFISTLNCPMTLVAKGDALPQFDAYCPVMSLPYAFQTTVETVPSQTPYLSCDETRVQAWRAKLGDTDRMRIGLVWFGSEAHVNDANRSIRLEELLSLFDLPVEWHSLQKEYRAHDLALLERHTEIKQHQDDLHDFADTAALIECLDLVISVDTSVAHVAGAIGKPVWILLPHIPDYRWMLDREDTPWYPGARLFRQPEAGDWPSVVGKVAQQLRELIRHHA